MLPLLSLIIIIIVNNYKVKCLYYLKVEWKKIRWYNLYVNIVKIKFERYIYENF